MGSVGVSTRVRLVIGLAVTTAIAVGLVGPVAAKDKRDLTVMTRNLYLGASVTPVLGATTPTEFLIRVAQTYGVVQLTDYPTRAAALAAEIDAADVDIVGLQEVSKWTASGPGAPPSLDFLAILLDELADRGLSYSVAAVSTNLTVGPVPLLLCGVATVGACLLSLQDRDVILVNTATPGLRVIASADGGYVAQQSFALPVGPPLSFDRGWVSIDGELDGKRFRFANTHLEVEGFGAVQEAQGREFLAGPGRGAAVIAVGDFNSAADGSTTSTYAELTKSWFGDAWSLNPADPGLTCCQNETLSNPASQLGSRIDLVLTHGAVQALEAHVVGATPFQGSAPFWASDHAGVVATVRLH